VGRIPDNGSSSKSLGNAHSSYSKQGRGTDSTPSFVFDARPTPVVLPQHLKIGRKRSRENEEIDMQDKKELVAPGGKRKKIRGTDRHGSARASPAPNAGFRLVEGEDISEEVESRLKAKEERRRKREQKRGEKRKRDSTNANEETSAMPSIVPPRNKKSKTGSKENSSDNREKGSEEKEKRRASDDAPLGQEDPESAHDRTMVKKRRKERSSQACL
jgi:hypothetical protein